MITSGFRAKSQSIICDSCGKAASLSRAADGTWYLVRRTYITAAGVEKHEASHFCKECREEKVTSGAGARMSLIERL